jgi:hypothetical protein
MYSRYFERAAFTFFIRLLGDRRVELPDRFLFLVGEAILLIFRV